MTSILQHHPSEFRTGRYFKEYPTLPLTEAGRVFRFTELTGNISRESDVIRGLEYSSNSKVITTTYDCKWKEKAYVLIEGEVWRINTFAIARVGTQAVPMFKPTQKQFTLDLIRVDNPTGVDR